MDYPARSTVEALNQVIEEMEFLVAHPRIQQKQWVAKGKTWLPTLRRAGDSLQREGSHYTLLSQSYQALVAALAQSGLELRQRERDVWAYRWHGGPLCGAFASQAEALRAALAERMVPPTP